MGIISLPYQLRDGIDVAKGSEVRANDDTITNLVNGNIDDDNVKVLAQIQGTKISNIAGSRIPFDRIEDAAVITSKLADSAVTTLKIADLNVTKAKLTTTGGLRITAAQIEFVSDQKTITPLTQVRSYQPGGDSGGSVNFSGVSIVPTVVAGNYHFRLLANVFDNGPSPDLIRMYDSVVDPNTIGMGSIPIASNLVLVARLENAVMDGALKLAGSLYVLWIKLT
jgi:hypothetical protein